jgi:hypothetical protein
MPQNSTVGLRSACPFDEVEWPCFAIGYLKAFIVLTRQAPAASGTDAVS